MSKLSIIKLTRNLIILVLCLLLLFGSQGISLAQPELDERLHPPDTSGASGIDGGPKAGFDGATCPYSSIAGAIAAAPPGATIYARYDVSHGRIGDIDRDLTITAASSNCSLDGGSYVAEIDATGTSAITGGIAYINTGKTVTFRNLILQNGTASSGGGGIYVFGAAVILENVQVLNNIAGAAGGGILLANSSTLTMIDSEIRGNTAGNVGGGIATGGMTPLMVIQDSMIIGNTAGIHGGGIYNESGAINIQDTNETTGIIDNDAGTGNGGAIYHTSSSTLEMYTIGDPSSIVIAANSAGMSGGGIYTSGPLDIQGNIQITGNEAPGFGGGLYIKGGDHRIRDKSGYRPWIQGNGVGDSGGGVYLDTVDETLNVVPGSLLDNVVITGNIALNTGGGIYADDSKFTLASSHVMDNTAYGHGGGIAAMNGSNITVRPNFPPIPITLGVGPTVCDPSILPADIYCSVIRNNLAGFAGTGYGGGVYLDGNSFATIYSTSFGNNDADYGGALFSDTGTNTINLFSNLFHHNKGTSVIKVAEYAPVMMVSNTVTDHTTEAISFDDPTSAVTFVGNIFWGNTDGVLGLTSATGACNNSQDGSLPDDIMADPQFVTTPRGHYRLGLGSPAIDQCTSGAFFDLDVVPRPYGAKWDMGAFEVHFDVYLPLTSRD